MSIPKHILFERVSPSTPGKLNAPTFAYLCLYGKLPPGGSLWGRGAAHEEVIWNGVGIDKAIPIKALDDLKAISKIELRSSCQGGDKDHPTYVIFRLKSHSEEESEKLANTLNSKYPKNLSSCSGIGNMGLPRIIVVTKLWYSDKNASKFEKWWLGLANKIKSCLV